jgi:hypothetical protein
MIKHLMKFLGIGQAKTHIHQWKLEYRTGSAKTGKSEVVSCECGQMAVRHYGQSEYILLK